MRTIVRSLLAVVVTASVHLTGAEATARDGGGAPRHFSKQGESHVASGGGVTARFDDRGVDFSAGSLGNLGLRLRGVGRGATIAQARTAAATASGDRLAYRRGEVTEWYVTTPVGIEQGFTVHEKPPGNGPLVVEIGVDTRLKGSLSQDARSLTFDAGEAGTLCYANLSAWDADGTTLPARLKHGQGSVQIIVEDGGASYPVTIDPLIYVEQKIISFDGHENDYFGSSVAIDGDTVLVGASADTMGTVEDPHFYQGSVYVYRRSGEFWYIEEEFTSSDGAQFDSFGYASALLGDTALVGAPYKNLDFEAQGQAYVFTRSGGVWTERKKLIAPNGNQWDAFGYSVALSAGTAIVGSYNDSPPPGFQGYAHVFTGSGDSWTHEGMLTPSSPTSGDDFGYAVAISGDTALVGAPSDSLGQGAVYVFTRNGGTWTQQARLVAGEVTAGLPYMGYFGDSVALDGDTALIGATLDTIAGNGQQGSVYVFRRSGTSWTQEAKLVAADGTVSDRFGRAVAISGDTALIGAPNDDVDGMFGRGSAYLFSRTGATWTQVGKFVASDGKSVDMFGATLDLSGDELLVGALTGDVGATVNRGAAYLYSTREPVPDLSVSAGASMTALSVGDTVILKASVFNHGMGEATGVTATCPLPSGLSWDFSSSTHGSYDQATGMWDVGALGESAVATLTIKAIVTSAAAGKTIDFSLQTEDANPTNNSATVSLGVGPPDIGLLATSTTTSPAVASTVTLTTTLANLGPVYASGVTASCPLPADLSLVSWAASHGSYDSGTGVWDLGTETLQAGASATLLIQASVGSAAAGKTRVFSAQSPWVDENPANNTSSVSLAVSSQEHLVNGGMETDAEPDKLPDGWLKTNWASSDGYNTGTKRSGLASVKLGGNGKSKVLQQQILNTYGGAPGDQFTLTAYGKAKSVPSTATYRAELLFYDAGGIVVLKKTVNFPKGTGKFALRTIAATIAQPYTSVLLKLVYKGTAGTVWFDDVSLLRTAP